MTFPWLFHDLPGFSMTYVVFHDYPGLEFGLPKSHDFPRLSRASGHPAYFAFNDNTPHNVSDSVVGLSSVSVRICIGGKRRIVCTDCRYPASTERRRCMHPDSDVCLMNCTCSSSHSRNFAVSLLTVGHFGQNWGCHR